MPRALDEQYGQRLKDVEFIEATLEEFANNYAPQLRVWARRSFLQAVEDFEKDLRTRVERETRLKMNKSPTLNSSGGKVRISLVPMPNDRLEITVGSEPFAKGPVDYAVGIPQDAPSEVVFGAIDRLKKSLSYGEYSNLTSSAEMAVYKFLRSS